MACDISLLGYSKLRRGLRWPEACCGPPEEVQALILNVVKGYKHMNAVHN